MYIYIKKLNSNFSNCDMCHLLKCNTCHILNPFSFSNKIDIRYVTRFFFKIRILYESGKLVWCYRNREFSLCGCLYFSIDPSLPTPPLSVFINTLYHFTSFKSAPLCSDWVTYLFLGTDLTTLTFLETKIIIYS